MKRLTWLFSVLAVLAVVAAIAPPPAQAACTSGGFQFGSAFPSNTYVYAPAPASINSGGSFRLGRFWEPTKRVAPGLGQDEGTCIASATCGGSNPEWWGRFLTAPWYINGQMDAGAVDGCPGVPGDGDLTPPDEIIAVLLDRDATPGLDGGDAYYYAARTAFHAADFPEFDMSQAGLTCTAPWAHFTMPPIPKPINVVSSRFNDNTVEMDFCLADVTAGFQGRNAACGPLTAYPTITGYRLCQFEGLADPGRLATAWTCADLVATSATPAARCVSNFLVACADVTPPIDNDRFLAIQLAFDTGTSQYLSEYVGRSVRVECNPNLAQPAEPTRRPERRLNQQPPAGKGPRRP